jgi:hypothetical protein
MKNAMNNKDLIGVPEGIRTPDLRFRKPLLYPAELPGPNPIAMRYGPVPPSTARLSSLPIHIPADGAREHHAAHNAIFQICGDCGMQRAKHRSALCFEVEADCLRPVTHIEFAEQITQMKFHRIDRNAEFPRQLSVATAGFQCGKKITFPVR